MSRKRITLLLLLALAGAYGVYLLLAPESAPPTAVDTDPRNEERTLVTFPEWYIVYSAQEYADFVEAGGRPSQFPYFGAIRQFWNAVDQVYASVDPEKIDPESKTVIRVIGVSFTVEYGLIGLYENTIGRVSEALNLFAPTTEDVFAAGVAREYGDFLTHTPWYSFPYFSTLSSLWHTYGYDSLSPRGLERRIVLSLGYALKGAYGAGLGYLTQSTYGYVETDTDFEIAQTPIETLTHTEGVSYGGTTDDVHATGTIKRYRAFKEPALSLVRAGGVFTSIEGNDSILVTFLKPTTDTCFRDTYTPALSLPVLTKDELRIGLLVPVSELGDVVHALDACALPIEHLYDY